MKSEIWISGALSNGELGDRLGIRAKYFDHDWEAPTQEVPPAPRKILDNIRRYLQGETLERKDFPEACYVYEPEYFVQAKDFFYLGGFAAVKGKLADILLDANLGNGGLVRIPVFKADKRTELLGPFFILNFGKCDDTFNPGQSKHIRSVFHSKQLGKDIWRAYPQSNDEIAVSSRALKERLDLWVDPSLRSMFFVSGSLVATIRRANVMEDYLRLRRCRIVE